MMKIPEGGPSAMKTEKPKRYWALYRACMQKEIYTFIHSKKSALIVFSSVLMPYLTLLTEGFGATEDMEYVLLAFLHIGAFAGVIQYIGDSTITDRVRKTFLMFHNMGIPFFMILLAKLTFSLAYLAFYFLGSLPITYSVLTLEVIMMSVLLALAFGMLTFSIVMLVFDPNSLLLTMYLPLLASFGLFMVYFNIPGLLGKGILVLLITAICSFCIHLVLKSKRLRYNL